MRFTGALPLLLLAVLLSASLPESQGQGSDQQMQNPARPDVMLKAIRMPPVWPSGEAAAKHIEGKVELRVVIDANGKVTEATPLSGPPELFEAALASVKQWEFERPSSAPVVQVAEISFGYPKPCPAAESDSGEVAAGGWYTSARGNVIEADPNFRMDLPPYFPQDREAGIAGDLRLWVSVDRQGRVKKIRVVRSLSPRLDKYAMKTVRTWRFKLKSANGGGFPDQFEVSILYQGLCEPKF